MSCKHVSNSAFTSSSCSIIEIAGSAFANCRRAVTASKFQKCTISSATFNKCSISGDGGAAHLVGTQLNITGCSYTECSCTSYGMAIHATTTAIKFQHTSTTLCTGTLVGQYLKFSGDSSVIFSNFSKNRATSYTAAFRVLPLDTSHAEVLFINVLDTYSAKGATITTGDSHTTTNLITSHCMNVIQNTYDSGVVGVIRLHNFHTTIRNMISRANTNPLLGVTVGTYHIDHCYFDCSSDLLGIDVSSGSNYFTTMPLGNWCLITLRPALSFNWQYLPSLILFLLILM